MEGNDRMKSRLTSMRRFALGAVGVCLLITMSGGCQTFGRRPKLPADGSIRAIWITRWDYKSASDIAKVMENCHRAGFNTVLFQVRGNGTAFYRSKLEPWAEELGGRDPGYDPLAVACKEARKRGLSLHAWANVIPAWRGNKPPTNPKQLYLARPDWFWRDAAGRRQPLGWYNSINPCYPEVRQYLVSVMREIVRRYPIDGLHLDYIRYPNEWNESYPNGASVPDYPRDPRTLALFKKATSKTPEQAPELWNEWRTQQLTLLVQGIHDMVRDEKPRIWLSAAVGADPDEARRRHLQDTKTWIARRWLDAVYPMNYDSNMGIYARRLALWASMRPRVEVVTGVMFDKRNSRTVAEQISRARRTTTHFAAFAYNSLFERLDAQGHPIMDEQSSSRAGLRQQVLPYVRRAAS